MSHDCSRFKLREKLVRLRRDYLCIGSSDRRRSVNPASTRTRVVDPGEVAAVQLPQCVGGCTRLGCDGAAQPAMTDDGAGGLSDVEQVGPPCRHSSVPSHWAAVLQSLAEEELGVASPVVRTASNCAEGQEEILIPGMTAATASSDEGPTIINATTPTASAGASFEYSSSTDNDQDDYYDEFVRGLQLTSVSVACSVSCSPRQPSISQRNDDIAARTVCGRRVVGDIQGSAATPCTVYSRRTSEQFERRRTSQQSERRSLGGKLMRTLRKTLSLTKNSEIADSGLSGCTPRASSLCDELRASTQPTGVMDNHPGMSHCQPLTV